MDGTNVYRESLDVVAMLILGEPGTFVKLLFLRGTRIFIEATIERAYSARQVQLPFHFPFHLSLPTSSELNPRKLKLPCMLCPRGCATSAHCTIQSDMEAVLR